MHTIPRHLSVPPLPSRLTRAPRLRSRLTQAVIVVMLAVVSTATGRSAGTGGGMPWEGPLNQVLDSLTGSGSV